MRWKRNQRKKRLSFLRFSGRIIAFVLLVSLIPMIFGDLDEFFILYRSQNGNNTGGRSGGSYSQDLGPGVDDEREYDFNGLNYTIIASMSESYFKEMLELYVDAEKGEIDSFEFHPPAYAYLALQIAETGYYPDSIIPLSYLPFKDGKVVWGEDYNGVDANSMNLRSFGTAEYEKAGMDELNSYMNEKRLANGIERRTPWAITEEISNISKISKTALPDFRFIPNVLSYLADSYSVFLKELPISSVKLQKLNDYTSASLFGALHHCGNSMLIQELFGIGYRNSGYRSNINLAEEDDKLVSTALNSFPNLIGEYLDNVTSNAKWYDLDSDELRETIAIVLAVKSDGWYISSDAAEAVDSSIVRVWRTLYPNDNVSSTEDCMKIIERKVKSLTDAIKEVTGYGISDNEVERIYRTDSDYDDSDLHAGGFVFHVSKTKSPVYAEKLEDGSDPYVVSAFDLETAAYQISIAMFGEKYYANMLKLGGLTDVDVTNPSSYKNAILIKKETTKSEVKDSDLSNVYAKCGIDLSKLSKERADILNQAAKCLGKTHYHWGGGHSENFTTGSDPPSYGGCKYYDLDCSGFVNWIFGSLGYKGISGTTATIASTWEPVSMDELLPGDVVVCNSHVQIFVNKDNNGRFWTIDVGGGGSGCTHSNNAGGEPVGCRLRTVSMPLITDGSSFNSSTGNRIQTVGDSGDGRIYTIRRCPGLDKRESSNNHEYLPSGGNRR